MRLVLIILGFLLGAASADHVSVLLSQLSDDEQVSMEGHLEQLLHSANLPCLEATEVAIGQACLIYSWKSVIASAALQLVGDDSATQYCEVHNALVSHFMSPILMAMIQTNDFSGFRQFLDYFSFVSTKRTSTYVWIAILRAINYLKTDPTRCDSLPDTAAAMTVAIDLARVINIVEASKPKLITSLLPLAPTLAFPQIGTIVTVLITELRDITTAAAILYSDPSVDEHVLEPVFHIYINAMKKPSTSTKCRRTKRSIRDGEPMMKEQGRTDGIYDSPQQYQRHPQGTVSTEKTRSRSTLLSKLESAHRPSIAEKPVSQADALKLAENVAAQYLEIETPLERGVSEASATRNHNDHVSSESSFELDADDISMPREPTGCQSQKVLATNMVVLSVLDGLDQAVMRQLLHWFLRDSTEKTREEILTAVLSTLQAQNHAARDFIKLPALNGTVLNRELVVFYLELQEQQTLKYFISEALERRLARLLYFIDTEPSLCNIDVPSLTFRILDSLEDEEDRLSFSKILGNLETILTLFYSQNELKQIKATLLPVLFTYSNRAVEMVDDLSEGFEEGKLLTDILEELLSKDIAFVASHGQDLLVRGLKKFGKKLKKSGKQFSKTNKEILEGAGENGEGAVNAYANLFSRGFKKFGKKLRKSGKKFGKTNEEILKGAGENGEGAVNAYANLFSRGFKKFGKKLRKSGKKFGKTNEEILKGAGENGEAAVNAYADLLTRGFRVGRNLNNSSMEADQGVQNPSTGLGERYRSQ